MERLEQSSSCGRCHKIINIVWQSENREFSLNTVFQLFAIVSIIRHNDEAMFALSVFLAKHTETQEMLFDAGTREEVRSVPCVHGFCLIPCPLQLSCFCMLVFYCGYCVLVCMSSIILTSAPNYRGCCMRAKLELMGVMVFRHVMCWLKFAFL